MLYVQETGECIHMTNEAANYIASIDILVFVGGGLFLVTYAIGDVLIRNWWNKRKIK
jgi:hypothetical protein